MTIIVTKGMKKRIPIKTYKSNNPTTISTTPKKKNISF